MRVSAHEGQFVSRAGAVGRKTELEPIEGVLGCCAPRTLKRCVTQVALASWHSCSLPVKRAQVEWERRAMESSAPHRKATENVRSCDGRGQGSLNHWVQGVSDTGNAQRRARRSQVKLSRRKTALFRCKRSRREPLPAPKSRRTTVMPPRACAGA